MGDAFFSFPPSFAQGASQSIESANDLFNDLNIIESFSGLSPTPTTFDPSKNSQLHSQAPLNPVDPVTKTFNFL